MADHPIKPETIEAFIVGATQALEIPIENCKSFSAILRNSWPAGDHKLTHRQSDLRPILQRYVKALEMVKHLFADNIPGEGRTPTARAHDEHATALVRACLFGNFPPNLMLPNGTMIDRLSAVDATAAVVTELRRAIEIARAKMKREGPTAIPSRGRSKGKSDARELFELTLMIGAWSGGRTTAKNANKLHSLFQELDVRTPIFHLESGTVEAAVKSARRRIKAVGT